MLWRVGEDGFGGSIEWLIGMDQGLEWRRVLLLWWGSRAAHVSQLAVGSVRACSRAHDAEEVFLVLLLLKKWKRQTPLTRSIDANAKDRAHHRQKKNSQDAAAPRGAAAGARGPDARGAEGNQPGSLGAAHVCKSIRYVRVMRLLSLWPGWVHTCFEARPKESAMRSTGPSIGWLIDRAIQS